MIQQSVSQFPAELTFSEKARLSCIFLLVYFFLVITYTIEISPKWASAGFYFDPSFLSIVMSVLILVGFPFVSSLSRGFRGLMLVFAFISIFIPTFVFLDFARGSGTYSFLAIFSLILIVLCSRLPIPQVHVNPMKPFSWAICLAVVVGLFTFELARTAGTARFSLDIFGVYESRRLIAESIGEAMNRAASIITKLLIPLLIITAFFFQKKIRFLIISYSMLCTIVIFGLWQHKSAVFLPIAVLICFLFIRRGDAIFKLSYVFTFACAALAVEALYNYFMGITYAGVLNNFGGRRALFVPALLNYYYIDYYSSAEYFGWYSLTQHLGVRPPDILTPPAFLIGMEYFDSDDMSANAGFIASGYTNAGVLGVAIYAALIGALISFVNSYGRRVGAPAAFALSVAAFHTALASSDLITTVLSHGLGLLLILFPLLPYLSADTKVYPNAR